MCVAGFSPGFSPIIVVFVFVVVPGFLCAFVHGRSLAQCVGTVIERDEKATSGPSYSRIRFWSASIRWLG